MIMRIQLNIASRLMSFLILLISCSVATAQKTYVTRQGFMVIKAFQGDSLNTYRFKNIMVILDYEKAFVDISFKLDDSLDDIAPSNRFFADYDAKITTRLSIPKIETQPHPDWDFHTEGELFLNEKAYYMTGNGELRHHDGSEILACYLMLRLEPMDGYELFIEPLGKVLEFHLFQTVLSQQSLDESGRSGY